MADYSYGWIAQRRDHRDRSYNAEEHVRSATEVPIKHDLWPNVPPIWNQTTIGSCTAHGSLRGFCTEAIKQGVALPKPPPGGAPLSRLMQYWDTRDQEGTTSTDSGGTVRDAIRVLASTGCAPESEWPYDVSKFTQKPPVQCYIDAKKFMSVEYKAITVGGPGAPIRSAIASGLAVVFGFSVPQSFEDGSWNAALQVLPLPGPNEGFIGGHCVALTGYDYSCTDFPEPYFIADNSWGTSWGGDWGGQGCTGGRFALAFSWFDPWLGLADDLWVIQAVK